VQKIFRLATIGFGYALIFFGNIARSEEAIDYHLDNLVTQYERDLDTGELIEFREKLSKWRSVITTTSSGQVIYPKFQDYDGVLYASPEPLDNMEDLRTLSTSVLRINQQISSLDSLNSKGVALRDVNRLYLESEIRSLTENLQLLQAHTQSVAPGQIKPIDEIEAFKDLLNDFSKVAIQEQSGWKDSPCNKARQDFYNNIEIRLNEQFLEVSKFQPQEKMEELANIAKEFDTKCLEPLNSASLPQILSPALKSRIAVIFRKGFPICGAFRLSKYKLVTAKHCFFEPTLGRQVQHTVALISGDSGSLDVRVLDDVNTRHSIVAISPNTKIGEALGPYSTNTDYMFVLVDTKNPISDPEQTSELEFNVKPLLHEPLLLVGYYLFHNSRFLFKLPDAEASEWANGLRATRGDYCRVFDISSNNQCFAHGCQSLTLFSGGPVIATGSSEKRNDKEVVRFLGIHSRDARDNDGCRPFLSNPSGINSAVGPQGGLAVATNSQILSGVDFDE
jgi:hypothetical protein